MTLLNRDSEQLSEHFTLTEFIVSRTAAELRIDNTAPPDVLNNLKRLALCCEQVRAELGGVPVIISSGYRSAKLNKAVGGVRNSRHLYGLACDFIAPDFGTPFAICKQLTNSSFTFDQLILEFSARSNWIHLGIAAKGETSRRQVLTINHHGTRAGLWA